MGAETTLRRYTDNFRKHRRVLQGRGVNLRETFVDGVSDAYPYGTTRITVPGLHSDDAIVSVLNWTGGTDLTGYLDDDFDQGPAVAKYASAFTDAYADGNFRLVAKAAGADGNDITIALTPGAEFGVAVSYTDIVVTYVAGETTAQDVVDGINADADASALVIASLSSVNDPDGIVDNLAEANLTGGADPGIELTVDTSGLVLKVMWVTRSELDEN
jgi:hypothetical protein